MSDDYRRKGQVPLHLAAKDEARSTAARKAMAAVNRIDTRDWWSLAQRRNAVRKALEAL